MANLWPWVVVAGAGALHGLNPASGWMLAAGRGLRSGDWRQALRALVPIAAGHAASVVVVATAVALGHSMEEWARPAMGLAAVLVLGLLLRGRGRRWPTATMGTALWSFVASTAHGSGMMLVPALVPLCLGDSPAREITATGSLALALAAVAVHTLALLGTVGLVAAGAVHGVAAARRRCLRRGPERRGRGA